MSTKTILKAGSREVAVSNLDKVFFPKTGFTKGDVLHYYATIAPVLLPHLKGRPVSLKRYPDGVEGEYFYEKQCPSHAPPWIKTARVGKKEGGSIDYCLLGDLPSLLWAANLANLEIHTFQHRAPALHRPTCVVFDLDPGPPAGLIECSKVAWRLKSLFDRLSLESFAKTSGSKGMQVVIPLNTSIDYQRTKAFAHHVAEELVTTLPELVVSEMKRSLRAGKVFIDWSQNDDKKTTVSPYSLRAKESPAVSTPLRWSEVRRASSLSKSPRPKNGRGILQFGPEDVLERVKKWGDLFDSVLSLKQKLPKFDSRLK